jgi:hypothetical protein
MADFGQARVYPDKNPSAINKKAKTASGTSTAEGIFGIGAIVLSILGIMNIFPGLLLAAATIAIGVALLFEGGAIAARYSTLKAASGVERKSWVRSTGSTVQFIAGVAGIAMSILSLLGFAPSYLLPISAIVYGGALVLEGVFSSQLSTLEVTTTAEQPLSYTGVRQFSAGTSGIIMLVGLAAIALGVFALVGISPLLLSLIAMLTLGAGVMTAGFLMAGRMGSVAVEH